jgi:hypothetical protein
MSLATRIARLERVAGTNFAPSEREYQEAEALLDRHAKMAVARLFELDLDPDEAALMMIAEKSGHIETARETKRRYWLARGVDIDERDRQRMEDSQAHLAEVFSDVRDG